MHSPSLYFPFLRRFKHAQKARISKVQLTFGHAATLRERIGHLQIRRHFGDREVGHDDGGLYG